MRCMRRGVRYVLLCGEVAERIQQKNYKVDQQQQSNDSRCVRLGVQPNTTQHKPTQHNPTQHKATKTNTTQPNTTQSNKNQPNTIQPKATQHKPTQHKPTQPNPPNPTPHKANQRNRTQHNPTQHRSRFCWFRPHPWIVVVRATELPGAVFPIIQRLLPSAQMPPDGPKTHLDMSLHVGSLAP